MSDSAMVELASLEISKERLLSQPFSKLMGAEMLAVSDDGCELIVRNREDLKQQYGFMHGGVLCYAADTALTIAGYRALRRLAVTSDLQINYLRPAIGDAIIARAKAVHSGRTQAVCRCEVFIVKGDSEKLCAIAQGTIVPLPARKDGAA